MAKKDIVARLRECDQGLMEECQEPELGDIVTDLSSISEAANVIERLRAERGRLRRERDETRRARDLALEERDEARLEIWENHPRNTLGARDFATVRGWECFDKENHNA
jgi:hypothetical protein